MLKSLNKQSVNTFINFIQKEKAKVIIHKVSDKSIDLKEVTDFAEKPAIASLLLDFLPFVNSKRLDSVGFNIVDHLEVLKYFFSIHGKTDEFIQLEDLYGAQMLSVNGKPHVLNVEFIEAGDDNPKARAQASYDAKRKALNAISAEGEALFYVYTEMEGFDKQQRIVYSWSLENISKLRDGLNKLANTIDLDQQPIIEATFKAREYKSPIVTSVKEA